MEGSRTRERNGVPTTDQLELAWAAGFFDGEGSVCVNHTRSRHPGRKNQTVYAITSPFLSVAQVEPEPLRRFARAVGGRVPTGPYQSRRANHRPYYRWDAYGRPTVHRILVLLWPYLSDTSKDKARRAWVELERCRRPKSPPLPPLPVELVAVA